jgi:hypothetical protein
MCRVGMPGDPARIAARLTREAWAKQTKERNFNRPLVSSHQAFD